MGHPVAAREVDLERVANWILIKRVVVTKEAILLLAVGALAFVLVELNLIYKICQVTL